MYLREKNQGGRLRRVCSRDCFRVDERKAVRRVPKKCRGCGSFFRFWESGGKSQAFCTKNCQKEQARKRLRRSCEQCARVYDPHPSQKESRFCSQACQWESMRGIFPRHKRKRVRGSIPRQTVWLKAGGICHVCGMTMLRSLRGINHPLAWVVDHVIPLARGGSDHPDNMLPAHRVCNRIKSAKPLDTITRVLASQSVVAALVNQQDLYRVDTSSESAYAS